MTNIGTRIKEKNAERGNVDIAALTAGHDRRQHMARVEKNDRVQSRRANGSRYSDITPYVDGRDHINLWDRGRTELGRALAIDTDTVIEVKGLGSFRSFYSLWIYLTSKNRTLAMRTAPAYRLRQVARDRHEQGNFDEGAMSVRYIMMTSLWNYIRQDADLEAALVSSDSAPLVSYVEHESTRSAHSQSKWWVDMVKLARATLISGGELDANFLRDGPGTYDQIVSPFVIEPVVLGRINRKSSAPAEKAKPVKAKQPKAPKPQPQAAAPAKRDATILGYDVDELNKSFSEIGGGLSYVVLFVGDRVLRNRLLFSALNRSLSSVKDEVAGLPMGTHLNPDHFLIIAVDESDIVKSASTWEFPNPLETDEQTVTGTRYDTSVIAELSKVLGEINAVEIGSMLQNIDDERSQSYHLKQRPDGKCELVPLRRGKEPRDDHKLVAKDQRLAGGIRKDETPVIGMVTEHNHTKLPKGTIFLGAPLSEKQALTGKAPEAKRSMSAVEFAAANGASLEDVKVVSMARSEGLIPSNKPLFELTIAEFSEQLISARHHQSLQSPAGGDFKDTETSNYPFPVFFPVVRKTAAGSADVGEAQASTGHHASEA